MLLNSIFLLLAAPIRILFIGNSYTYVNNVPEMVEGMAKGRVEAAMVATGGATLEGHWNEAETRHLVMSGHWTFVVLQEQSTFGVTLFVDGLARVSSSSGYLASAKKWAKFIREYHATPVIMQFWPYADAPARDFAAIRFADAEAARATGSKLLRVGDAWQFLRRDVGAKALYQDDGSHPLALGSYLYAAVVAKQLASIDTSRLPDSISGRKIGLDEVKEPSTTMLVRVTPAQKAAIVRSIMRSENPASAKAARPPSIEFPSVGTGEPVSIDNLKGEWHGVTNLYPKFVGSPAKLRISIQSLADGDAAISFPGKAEPFSGMIQRITLVPDQFRFALPGGPNKSYLLFTGVLRKGLLSGVAKMILPNGDLLAIGGWSAAKSHQE